MDAMMITESSNFAAVATLRDYLLPRLLSGRVRVGEAASHAEGGVS